MPTKTKLEQAVETQAKNLDPAQKELVMSQFSTYKWNRMRIREIEDMLNVATLAKKPIDPKLRKQLMTERHQLTTDNVSISSKLFMQLKGTANTQDEFDKFIKGGE